MRRASSRSSNLAIISLLPRGQLQRFCCDKRGEVAILFGLMSVVLFAMVGVAIDYARFVDARTATIAAADAAALAGARALQTNGGDQAAALGVARIYYAQATKNRIPVVSDTIDFQVNDNGTAILTKGNAQISTPFMALGGIKSLPLYRSNGLDYSKAVIAVGSNASTNIETSLILDVSGSMAGDKIASLKSAATDLVNIIVGKDQSQYTSKVAVVPYSMAVNAGTFAQAARGSIKSGTCTAPGCQNFTFKNSLGQQKTFAVSTCVSERTERMPTPTPRRAPRWSAITIPLPATRASRIPWSH